MAIAERNKRNESELYLNLKINSTINGVFDYSLDKYDNYNLKIENIMYIIKNENKIKTYDKQSEKKSDEDLLFKVEKKNNLFQFNIIHLSNQNFVENLDNYFWYLINSDSNKIGNTNDDYYLSENDIIKIANVKYILREIKIKNNNQKNNDSDQNVEINQDLKGAIEEKMKEKLSSLDPPCLDCKKCEYCGCLLVKFCKCEQFEHFKCIKNWIKDRISKKENIGKTFRYYHFKNIYKCEVCNTYVPLKFKLNIKEPFQCKLNDNDEEYLNFNKNMK